MKWVFWGLLICGASWTHAGTLVNGVWAPENCGHAPQAPIIDDHDVDAFNKSVAEINDWQSKTKTYYECLIKEANTDNTIVADTANKAQAEHRETVERIGATANAAKKKLDGR